MNKISYILITVLILSACTKPFDELNVNPKKPQTVPSETLFTNAQKEMSDQVASTNVNLNNFKLWAQYWQETTYLDESNYDMTTRSVPDNAWQEWYRNTISDLTNCQQTITTEAVIPGTEQMVANQTAVADLLILYSYQRLVDMFGNVPYSQAMQIESNLLPAYDDAWTIYESLVDRLDNDIAVLETNPSAGSFGSADLMYGGDVNNWIAFAYGLKLKLGMHIWEYDPTTSQQWVEDAAPHVFTSNAQNCKLDYLGATPNTNPLYVDLVLSGRQDFVACQTLTDTMNFYSDGRLAQYFTMNPDGEYTGGAPGEQTSYAANSHPGDKLIDPTFPCVLMSYDEVQFYLAEAAERGYSVGGSAQSFYENAINASFEYWGASGASDHLVTDDVAWGTGTHSNLQKIARESWVAFYNRGFLSWTQIRRLNFPLPLAAAPQDGVYPLRCTYPVNEQTLNGANYTQAAAAIGGDEAGTALFWDLTQ
jgi:hypothetical protein